MKRIRALQIVEGGPYTMAFGNMRRKKQQVTALADIRRILQECTVMNVGMVDFESGFPYVVPLNYGFQMSENGEIILYAHIAGSGRKLELLRECDKVCVAINRFWELERAPVPCDWTLSYDSLIAEGKATLAEGEEKKSGMDSLMAHYGMQGVPSYRPGEFNAMQLLKISVLRYTAKQYRGSDYSSGNYNLADHS